MPLTEAQRLAFLKGREKRMANIEKAKLEKQEMELFSKEADASAVPEKPKVTRKPRKTKAVKEEPQPVDVKIDIDLGTAVAKEDTVPEIKQEEPEPVPPVPAPVSAPAPAPTFDEDAIANKVVSMLMQKGIGVPQPPASPVKKTKKPRTSKPKAKVKPVEEEFQPRTNTFTWL